MTARLLVTGGEGFLGGAVMDALACHPSYPNWPVIIDTKSGGDVCNAEFVERIVADVQPTYLLHFAAINGTHNFYERSREVFEVGCVGTLNVVQAYRNLWRRTNGKPTARGCLFVFVSSSEVYHDTLGEKADETRPLGIPDLKNPRYSYSSSKIAGEAMVRYMLADCPRAIVVRPHNVYGPGMKNRHVMDELAGQFRAKADPITVQALDPVRAYCHIEDFVSGFLAVMERGQHGETYHIGDDTRPVSVGELVQEFTEASGHGCEVRVTSAPSGSPSYRCPDVTKLRSLGWTPRKTLSEGVREMLGWA